MKKTKVMIRAFAVAVCIVTCAFSVSQQNIFAEDPPLSEIVGDLNLDYKVDAADLFALRYYMHGALIISNTKNADMDQNGQIDIVDYILMKSAIIEQ